MNNFDLFSLFIAHQDLDEVYIDFEGLKSLILKTILASDKIEERIAIYIKNNPNITFDIRQQMWKISKCKQKIG